MIHINLERIWEYLIGIVEQNAHIIYETVTKKKVEHWQFLLNLSIQLSGLDSVDIPVNIIRRKCFQHVPTHTLVYDRSLGLFDSS